MDSAREDEEEQRREKERESNSYCSSDRI